MSPPLTPILEPSIEHAYQMEGQHMWEADAMLPFVPQYAMPAAGLHAQVPPTHPNPANVPLSSSGSPTPSRLSVSGTGDLINVLSPQCGLGEDQSSNLLQRCSGASTGTHPAAPKQSTAEKNIACDEVSKSTPSFQQVVTQLSMQRTR
jgi:hypothetical protein